MEQPHMTADELVYCGRWNSHFVTGWCYCHGGRWNSHWLECFNVVKADFITLLADVIAKGHYFNFSSVLLTRTSSHMWARWYLPIFLFRDGLLTLIYIDSLINLERFCSSLPTILKLLSVVEWPVMLLWSYIGEGAFRCSFNLSPKCSSCLPYVLLITFQPVTSISVNYNTFCGDMIFVFGCHNQWLFHLPPWQ